MIGPSIPAHLLAKRSTTPDDNDETEAGPSAPSIGPSIPQNLQSPQRHIPTSGNEPQEEEEEDDYTPALPPDLVAARSAPPSSSSNAKSKPVAGPTLSSQSKLRSTHPQLQREDEEDSDDDYGPQPLPQGVVLEQNEGVREFLEKEERRRKQIEVRRPSILFFCRFSALMFGFCYSPYCPALLSLQPGSGILSLRSSRTPVCWP